MSQQSLDSSYRRLVIKLGTNLITGGGSSLSLDMMTRLVEQAADLQKRGVQVIIVSSGAVAAGRKRLGSRKKRRDTPYRQMMAAVGQGRLMRAYDELFEARGIVVAQTLLTKPDFLSRLGYLNARNTLLALLEAGVVPIVNENDVVFVEELEGSSFGDNDNLSAMVASMVDADLLIILSDVAGLYTADPSHDSSAELIRRVEKIDKSIERLGRSTCGEVGTGGMTTKIQAAKLATASGVAVVIASGAETDVLLRIYSGEDLGTFFAPSTSRLESRKRWMLGQPAPGKVMVDDGARSALRGKHRSLLPAGITGVQGYFGRGDVISIIGADGEDIARGISNYKSEDVDRIKGCRSERIEEILGYGYGDEVVHRDNMVDV